MHPTAIGNVHFTSICFFLLFVFITLGISFWAAKSKRSSGENYVTARSVTCFQNGLALAGDYMSAASFLGIAGLVSVSGYDGLIYSVGWLAGWPIILFLFSEPLRNLGKYSFADVVGYRFEKRPVRAAAVSSSIVTVLLYLVAQMVGAGTLIRLMFGLSYESAVTVIGFLMIAYVLFGGVVATTWIRIIKTVLLLGGVTLIVMLTLAQFGFSYGELFGEAAKMYGDKFLEPGGLVKSPLEAFSLGLALMFGAAGLPHILMRFYTVPDVREARKSVFYATGLIGYFYILTATIGFGAAVLVSRKTIVDIDAGGNMAAPLLAEFLGGTPFLGFVAALAFSTILAVVAGLTLAGASALSHDLYVGIIRHGESNEKTEIRVARFATVALGLAAILLGIFFKGQNVAVIVGLAFAIAASANFPAMLLSMKWIRFTTKGAVVSIYTGLIVAAVLIILSPTVWVDVLHDHEKAAIEKQMSDLEAGSKWRIEAIEKEQAAGQNPVQVKGEIAAEVARADAGRKELAVAMPKAIFPMKNPAVFSMGLAFLAGILVSLITTEKQAQAKFYDEKLKSYIGIKAE